MRVMAVSRLRKGFGRHKKPVSINADSLTAVVSLGKCKSMYIDLAEMSLLEEHSFYAHKRNDGQFVARSSQTGEYAHRLLLKPHKELDVDHINHDPLDNRLYNLRACTSTQNNLAKEISDEEEFIGICKVQNGCYERERGRLVYYQDAWAAIGPDGQQRGRFSSQESAAKARDEMYIERYLYSEAEWHTFNFIQWNGDMSSYSSIADYRGWMREVSRQQDEWGKRWLMAQPYGRKLVSRSVWNFQLESGYLDELVA